jgi:hypothetical protein
VNPSLPFFLPVTVNPAFRIFISSAVNQLLPILQMGMLTIILLRFPYQSLELNISMNSSNFDKRISPYALGRCSDHADCNNLYECTGMTFCKFHIETSICWIQSALTATRFFIDFIGPLVNSVLRRLRRFFTPLTGASRCAAFNCDEATASRRSSRCQIHHDRLKTGDLLTAPSPMTIAWSVAEPSIWITLGAE